MLVALSLGLAGSLGHCAGMCSGIVLLLNRALGKEGGSWAWVQLHSGRLLAYAALGFLAGSLGQGLAAWFDQAFLLQGAVAFYAALLGLYFVFVLLGLAPGPENLFPGLVRGWGRAFRKMTGSATAVPRIAMGFAWGLLPCGLTLTALFTAATSASAPAGALRMTVFGIATLPVLVSVRWLAGLKALRSWPRYGAAAVLALFSLQIGMRGMAAFGFVDHLMLGGVMLW